MPLFEKGQIPWNKGLTGQKYKEHYGNGFKGIFEKGIHPATGFKKGNIPWHSGTKIDKEKYPNYGHQKPHSEKTREKLSKSHIGIQSGENHPMWGKHHKKEAKEKIGAANRGANNKNWKGGVTSAIDRKVKSFEWKILRQEIYRRDGWFCQICACDFRPNIRCHHIVSVRDNGTDDPNNLITLCLKHHAKIERSKCQDFWRYYLRQHIKISMN